MKQENWYDVDSLRNKDYAMSTAFPALMRKVFVWMTLALAITGLTAYGVATSPTILSLIFSSKVTFFGLIIAEFALVFGNQRCYSVDDILRFLGGNYRQSVLHHSWNIRCDGARRLHNQD